jgi:PPP family 3-phenylpropionic acid transporter
MTEHYRVLQFDHPWKLASFYFFFFAIVGGIAPFLPLYLASLGYNAVAVGQLMAIIMLTKMVAPNLWGWVADRTGQRLALVRMGGIFSCLFFTGFICADGFWSRVAYLAMFSCFWNAVLPQWEVITLYNLDAERARYSRIRLWGSVGFIVAVTGLGWFFEFFSISWLGHWLLGFICLMTLFGALVKHQPATDKGGSFSSFCRNISDKNIALFFITAFLLQLSFGPYYTFLSIYLEELGYSKITTGLFWAVGVVAEVVLFVYMHHIIRRVSLKLIILTCLLLTSLRWFGISQFADLPLALVGLQLLHAASFGGLHAASIEFVHRAFAAGHAGQAQALYSALSFGAGGGLGAWGSGLLVDALGTASAFSIAGWVTVIASFLLMTVWRHLSPVWEVSCDHY